MPGAFCAIYLLAFNLDQNGQAVRAFEPRLAATEAAALEEAQDLAQQHAGVLVWKREGDPVVGEEGDPVVIFQTGATGDFD